MLRWALVGDILVAALAVVLAAVVATGYRNASATPLVRRLTLHLPDYPPSARPIRIVLVSDLHVHGPETPPARVERLVTQVNGLHPDVDVIAGDFIGGGSVGAQYPPAAAIAPLGRLQATFGAFAILGNNDFPADQVVPALRQARIRVLSNEATEVGPIALGGLDGRFLLAPAVLRAERAKTYAELRRTPGVKVLVSHSPDEIMAAPPWVRLILAGHTHCGQIVLPIFGPIETRSRYGRKFYCGIVRQGPRLLVVTSGIGTSHLPLRIGAPPDIWLITVGR